MLKNYYYVMSDELYHTGDFSRELPPSAYLGCLEGARIFFSLEDAKLWVSQFGGDIVSAEKAISPAQRINDLEFALSDAISTYIGNDKIVSSERIETWQAVLKG